MIEVWQKPEDKTLALSSGPIEQRSTSRREYQERKRQENIERITSIAAAELVSEQAVPNERPDPDWITRFFGNAEDVTSEQLQELWGRILAGEIKRPGSYSLRSLEFVKSIGKQEADLFEKLGRLGLISGPVAVIPVNDKTWLQRERNIYASEHFQLAELGVMYPADLALRFFDEAGQSQLGLAGDQHLLLINRGKIASAIELPVWKFTQIGTQLLSLVARPLDEAYLEYVGRWFMARGGEAAIARITERFGADYNYDVIKRVQSESQGSTPVADIEKPHRRRNHSGTSA